MISPTNVYQLIINKIMFVMCISVMFPHKFIVIQKAPDKMAVVEKRLAFEIGSRRLLSVALFPLACCWVISVCLSVCVCKLSLSFLSCWLFTKVITVIIETFVQPSWTWKMVAPLETKLIFQGTNFSSTMTMGGRVITTPNDSCQRYTQIEHGDISYVSSKCACEICMHSQ